MVPTLHRGFLLATCALLHAHMGLASDRLSIPTAEEQKKAEEAVRRVFPEELKASASRQQRVQAAAAMVQAAASEKDPQQQYVLLRLARELAAGSGDWKLALRASHEMAARFRVDPMKLEALSLRGVAPLVDQPEEVKEVLRAIDAHFQRAIREDDLSQADSLAQSAALAARRSRDASQLETVSRYDKVLATARKQWPAAQEALARLAEDPLDPAANLTAGKYRAFVQGDWSRGLNYLALGSDETLRSMALADLQIPRDGKAREKLGRQWIDAATKQVPPGRVPCLLRGADWLRSSLPGLSGLARVEVEKALSMAGNAGKSELHATLPAAPMLVDAVGMELVLIPAGEFSMGAPDWDPDALAHEKPQHQVQLTKSFYLGVHEVTVGQFAEFVEATGYRTEWETAGTGGRGFEVFGPAPSQKPIYSWRNTGFKQSRDFPVANVTWKDATAFCAWLSEKERTNYRLPTEAEWEYACRARTLCPYGTVPTLREATALANIPDALGKCRWGSNWKTPDTFDGYALSSPVGRFPLNAFGLTDMQGNLMEWVEDQATPGGYNNYPAQDPAFRGEGGLRVVRGGTWCYAATMVRASHRFFPQPDMADLHLGFRVVRERP
ncbi:MAG: formylglycine-generating enzyme family protein [Pirellulaceae bacterium]